MVRTCVKVAAEFVFLPTMIFNYYFFFAFFGKPGLAYVILAWSTYAAQF